MLKDGTRLKLFEYYASGKPIFLVPSDHDVMEDFILNAKCGKVSENLNSCIKILNTFIENKEKEIDLCDSHDQVYAHIFSRQNQTKNLAELLNKH